MLNNQVFYWGTIRKTIVSFGRLFSDIYIDRKQGDSVNGETIQRLSVPIAYGPKEKWLVRLDSDPTLENHTYTTLPRLSFEITGYTYDPQRKINKMNKVSCITPEGSTDVFSPVPYNIEITLYVLTKTQEDAFQIIEQILPTFGPEYTLAIKTNPEMNIIQDVPVVLNSISVMDEYDGDFATRRFVTHTLNFTLKLNLYGNINSNKRIYTVNANVGLNDPNIDSRFTASVNPETGEIINEEWIDGL